MLRAQYDPQLGRVRPRAEVPAGVDDRVPAAPRRRSTSRSARSTACAPAACTTSSAAASTATRSTRSGSCRTSRRCSTTTRCSSPRICTRSCSRARTSYRSVVEDTIEYALRELRLDGGGFASAQDADTDGVEGLTFTLDGRGARGRDRSGPRRAAPALRARPLDRARPARRARSGRRSSRFASSRPKPLRDDKAIAGVERADARRARRSRAAGSSAPTGSTRRASSPSSCSGRSPTDGRLHRTWRNGVAKGTGYLEDYADVAHGLYELHVATGELRWLHEAHRLARARGRALRRRRARRVLPHAVRRRAARRAPEGSRRQPDAVRQLDARVRAAAAGAHLGRRRARAARGRRAAARPRRHPAGAVGVRLGALRARPAPLAAAGARDRRRAGQRRSRGPPCAGSSRTRSSPSARRTTCRCSPARTSSDGQPAVYVCERFACRAPGHGCRAALSERARSADGGGMRLRLPAASCSCWPPSSRPRRTPPARPLAPGRRRAA